MHKPLFHHLALAALALTPLLGIGCASSMTVTRLAPAEVNLAGIKRIAITRIDGPDGETFATMVSQRILDSKRYEVVERAQMDKIAAEHRDALDAAFEQNQGVEIGKLLPAAALIAGQVNESKVDDRVSSHGDTCTRFDLGKLVRYPCTRYARSAKARFVTNVRVFDTNTSKVLVSRRLVAERKKETTAADGEPAPVDTDALLDQCRNEVADQFLKMIAPHPVQERVALEEDGALPELKQGNEYLKRGDPGTAAEFYARAVARADANPSFKPDVKGRAHYSFGLGKAMTGDYDTALAELRMAQTMKPEPSWMDLEMRVRAWKQDADKVSQQMRDAAPATAEQP
jgi:tetratricopeptide (TPR) repeat protein